MQENLFKNKMKYRFIKKEVTDEDIKRIIQLTEDQILEWVVDKEYYAFSCYPFRQFIKDDKETSHRIIGENLRGARLGCSPNTRKWHYLRLRDENLDPHYIEEGSSPELIKLVDALYYAVFSQVAHRKGMRVAKSSQSQKSTDIRMLLE